MALLQNAHVSVLKLGYNDLGDEGVRTLASGLAQHQAIESLDLGFNKVGDDGVRELAGALQGASTLNTLYLAGNLIGPEGSSSIADLLRNGRTALRKLYLTSNKLGPEGTSVICDAIIERETVGSRGNGGQDTGSLPGVQELFLGGTEMSSVGCQAVGRLLRQSTSLRVLSLPNCDFDNECISVLSHSIKSNRERLPLEVLQLSFNCMSCRGMELLSNAIWGSYKLKTLKLDNNHISDAGVQHLAGVLPTLSALETLDVGFNDIKTRGMIPLMQAVVESQSLSSLSISGNALDMHGVKALAYAIAHSCSLKSVSVVRCSLGPEGRRQIVAGVVSNSRTVLRNVEGLVIGPAVVTLGFPASIEHWSNEQVLNFVHLMWARYDNHTSSKDNNVSANDEKDTDPLFFLGGGTTRSKSKVGPIEPSIVVELAKKTYDTLVQDGADVLSKLPNTSHNTIEASPIATDNIVYESAVRSASGLSTLATMDRTSSACFGEKTKSFVVAPQAATPIATHEEIDPMRKKRIAEWLCTHLEHLNNIAQQPFNSSDLSRLYQHYFSPVVNESGGSAGRCPSIPLSEAIDSFISRETGDFPICATNVPLHSSTSTLMEQSSSTPNSAMGSLPMLKRKVSYRFLGDATLSSAPKLAGSPSGRRQSAPINQSSTIPFLLDGGPVGSSLPPKTKRARRNRSRISFLPRLKARLDVSLARSHGNALTLMRQLHYVEHAILGGQLNQIDPSTVRTHLCAESALDAETILVDML